MVKQVEQVSLNLSSLSGGIPALTAAMGAVQAECAAVCLEQNNHVQEVPLCVPDVTHTAFTLSRQIVTAQMRRAHHDMQVATEYGAYGVAILLVRQMTGLTAIQRSRKGTGFDYWLGKPSKRIRLPFQNKARLEVSGILCGEDKIDGRLKAKETQTKRSDGLRCDAYAVVVEFGRPKAKVRKR